MEFKVGDLARLKDNAYASSWGAVRVTTYDHVEKYINYAKVNGQVVEVVEVFHQAREYRVNILALQCFRSVGEHRVTAL